jgi:hypothetical protein
LEKLWKVMAVTCVEVDYCPKFVGWAEKDHEMFQGSRVPSRERTGKYPSEYEESPTAISQSLVASTVFLGFKPHGNYEHIFLSHDSD